MSPAESPTNSFSPEGKTTKTLASFPAVLLAYGERKTQKQQGRTEVEGTEEGGENKRKDAID